MTPLTTIHPRLHIGDDSDATALLRTVRRGTGPWQVEPAEDWHIIHAAKTPWHATMAGYPQGSAAPEDSPERWWADRPRRTALNLVDSPHQLEELVLPILDHAAKRISQHLATGGRVLVHCNMGHSRSPATALWWMHRTLPHETCEDQSQQLLANYPDARLDTGIGNLVRRAWK